MITAISVLVKQSVGIMFGCSTCHSSLILFSFIAQNFSWKNFVFFSSHHSSLLLCTMYIFIYKPKQFDWQATGSAVHPLSTLQYIHLHLNYLCFWMWMLDVRMRVKSASFNSIRLFSFLFFRFASGFRWEHLVMCLPSFYSFRFNPKLYHTLELFSQALAKGCPKIDSRIEAIFKYSKFC